MGDQIGDTQRVCRVFDVWDEVLIPIAHVALTGSDGQLFIKDRKHRHRGGSTTVDATERDHPTPARQFNRGG